MSSSAIVQKLLNYFNVLRDDLSACRHAQAGGMSYLLARGLSALASQAGAQASGDYPSVGLRAGPSTKFRTGVGQVTSSRCRPLEERCRQFLGDLL